MQTVRVLSLFTGLCPKSFCFRLDFFSVSHFDLFSADQKDNDRICSVYLKSHIWQAHSSTVYIVIGTYHKTVYPPAPIVPCRRHV